MKKIIYSIMLIFLLALAACGTQTQPQSPTEPSAPAKEQAPAQTEVNPSAPTGAIKEQAAAAGCKGSENIDKLKKSMEDPNQVLAMDLAVNSYLDVKKGECVIFPVAIRNNNLEPKEYMLEVYFSSAKDRAPIPNTMEADKNVMNTWITIPASKTLLPHQYSIFPIEIKVGDMITDSSKMVPGTYRFTIQAYYRTGESSRVVFEPSREIFVRVLE